MPQINTTDESFQILHWIKINDSMRVQTWSWALWDITFITIMLCQNPKPNHILNFISTDFCNNIIALVQFLFNYYLNLQVLPLAETECSPLEQVELFDRNVNSFIRSIDWSICWFTNPSNEYIRMAQVGYWRVRSAARAQ